MLYLTLHAGLYLRDSGSLEPAGPLWAKIAPFIYPLAKRLLTSVDVCVSGLWGSKTIA